MFEPIDSPTKPVDKPLASLKHIKIEVHQRRRERRENDGGDDEYLAALLEWFPNATNTNIQVISRFDLGHPDSEDDEPEAENDSDGDDIIEIIELD